MNRQRSGSELIIIRRVGASSVPLWLVPSMTEISKTYSGVWMISLPLIQLPLPTTHQPEALLLFQSCPETWHSHQQRAVHPKQHDLACCVALGYLLIWLSLSFFNYNTGPITPISKTVIRSWGKVLKVAHSKYFIIFTYYRMVFREKGFMDIVCCWLSKPVLAEREKC